MKKFMRSVKKDTREQIKYIATHRPKQTEKEIFSDIDTQGFNHNPSEQETYPGVQKHACDNKVK